MQTRMAETAAPKERASSQLVELLLSPFDVLAEVDLDNDTFRCLHHTPGKTFLPRVNGSLRDYFQYAAEYMIHPDDREEYIRCCDPDRVRWQAEDSESIHRFHFRYKLNNGGWYPVEQVVIGGPDYGMPDGVYYIFLLDDRGDPGEVGTIDQSFWETIAPAECNELTGLFREELFFTLAKRLIREQKGRDWCVLAIDLEHFKIFNEWYGRKQGDLTLAAIGAILLRTAEEMKGIACYIGQDDFAMLIPRDMARIERLYDELHELIKKHGTSVGFMPAFGIGGINGGETKATVYDLYDRAALAARRAKDNYHERIRTFASDMYEQTDRDYHILSDFQKALREHELFIQLQPQCLISNGRVVGAESLVRWRKADGTIVPPGVFVPVLEKYGFVTDLDKYVWEEICIWQRQWINSGHTPLPVSVNVSQIDIFTIDVPDYFEALIKKYDLPFDVIKMEITESAYVDNDIASETVRRLREKGFLVLMDDFGSGYSSLNMLRNLNVDIIKLDAQFLRMSGDDRKGVQIMESIVTMAKTMGVPIIVEGVETKEESDFLSKLGCRYVQGYYFYRPMQIEEFERLIGDVTHIDTHGFRFRAKEQFHIREFLDQNLFSDTVLNNILGPVAFYAWNGNDVDIVRYNQQFRDEIKTPGLAHRMKSIQEYAVAEDVPRLYDLLERAAHDPINGSGGVLRFFRRNGSIAQMRVHFFFLRQEGENRLFYGSIHDLTEFITLNDHMRLLSQVSRDTIVFVRKRGAVNSYHVVVHGLAKELGVGDLQLEMQMGDGSFFRRFDEQERSCFTDAALKSAGNEKAYSFTVMTTGINGMVLPLSVRFDYVHDEASGVEYIITFRRAQ